MFFLTENKKERMRYSQIVLFFIKNLDNPCSSVFIRVLKRKKKGIPMLSSDNKKRILQLFAVSAALLLILVAGSATANATTPQKDAAKAVVKPNPMAEKWGIQITSLRLTANGNMVDFRYRVLDAEKAGTLFVRQNKPYLIDQASAKVLAVPNTAKVGPLRNSNKPKQGRIYWMFFGNTHKLVKAGSKVTIEIGDFRAENLIVE
jgi:hypothetical protein